jgi:anti-sigma factor RsiW
MSLGTTAKAQVDAAIHVVIGPCARVREFLLDYLEGTLPAPTRLRFRLHLLLCRACKRYLAQYHTGVEWARAVESDPPPPELVDLTLEFLKKHPPRKPQGSGPS